MDRKLLTGLQVTLGFLLGVALNVVVFQAGLLLAYFLRSSTAQWIHQGLMIAPGAIQLIYQIPLILFLRLRRHRGLALGVILAASVYALLNALFLWLAMSGKVDL